MPGGTETRAGGPSPPAHGKGCWVALSSCFLGIPRWPLMPSGHQTEERERGWGSGKGTWQQNPSPWFWEGGGSEGSPEGLCWTSRGRCRSPPLAPCSVHNKDLFFSLILHLVPVPLRPFGMARREGKLRTDVFPQPFSCPFSFGWFLWGCRCSAGPGCPQPPCSLGKGLECKITVEPPLYTPKWLCTPAQIHHIPGGSEGAEHP